MSSAKFIFVHIVYVALLISCATRAESEPGLPSPLSKPVLGFWFGEKYVKCPVTFEDFFQCCDKYKCAKNAGNIYGCCSGSTKTIEPLNEDELAKCVLGVETFVKQLCESEGRDYCNVDDDISMCCKRSHCNVKELKDKYCCN